LRVARFGQSEFPAGDRSNRGRLKLRVRARGRHNWPSQATGSADHAHSSLRVSGQTCQRATRRVNGRRTFKVCVAVRRVGRMQLRLPRPNSFFKATKRFVCASFMAHLRAGPDFGPGGERRQTL
jgi:hypothetical protein